MKIGDRGNLNTRVLVNNTRKAPAQTRSEASTASSSSPDTFQASAFQTVAPKGPEGNSVNIGSILRSAGSTALHVAGTVVPGLVGAGLSAVKDVVTGSVRNSHFENRVEAESEEAASRQFAEAKDRLLNPNEWKKLGPSFGAASFQVYGQETGKPSEGPPREGDYLKIGLPDPFPYVWVQIEKVETGDKQAEVVVRPSKDPTGSSNAPVHLFSDETVNVFRLKQEGNVVTSSVSGLNEKLNTEGGVFSRVLAASRLAGAWAGGKKPQWNAFTRKILEGPAPAKALQATGVETALRAATADSVPK